MLNLNMGSGSNRKQDYVSVDLYTPEADLGIDLTKPLMWDDNTVDNIYASHVVEHFSRDEWELVRKEWARVLKPGGCIEIRCPDIVKVCEKFLKNPDDNFTMMQLYGLQSNEGEFHKNGFTYESLCSSFPDFTPELLEPSTDTEVHARFTKDV
jgi:predicted SAM-dependent methyltransferase